MKKKMEKKMGKKLSLIILCLCLSTLNLFAKDHPIEQTKKATDDTKQNQAAKASSASSVKNSHSADKKSAISNKTVTAKLLEIDSVSTLNQRLENYFNHWLKCGNNCATAALNYKDILKLIENENITGEQAAVLGAVITYVNTLSNPNKTSLTLSEIQNLSLIHI